MSDTHLAKPSGSPSPLVGEGARRADEGDSAGKTALLRRFARSMRSAPTEQEARLWTELRDRRFAGFKFRRQVPIGRYIADFVCFDRRLIVELDGSQHAESVSDVQRDEDLNARGFRILRIWNNELTQSPELVFEAIWAALHEGEKR